MGKETSRKKTVDKLTTPDDLHKFIKIVNPKIWAFIIAIIAVLIGVLVWGFVGRLETKILSFSFLPSQGGIGVNTYIQFKEKDRINKNQIIRVGNKEYAINDIGYEAQRLDFIIENPTELRKIKTELGWRDGELVLELHSDTKQGEENSGFFTSTVIIETTPPIAFLFN